MVETRRKTKGIEFLRELEEFVRERTFPRRVIDSVVELRKELEIEETPAGVEKVLLQIPELMDHIGRKYKADLQPESEPFDDRIRLEDVQERVKEILILFKDKNGPLEEQYKHGQSLAKTELETGIREILHTNAHYDSLRNGGRFCNYMAGVEQNYGTRIGQLLQSCTEDLFQNCDQTAARIKSLFTHIKDEKLQAMQRRMYQQYDSKYDIVKQKISARAAQLSGEQKAISQWAAGCVKPMEEIKKKINRKKYGMILVPLILALIAIPAFRFVMNVNVGQTGNQAAVETVEETEMSIETVLDYVIDNGADYVKDKVLEQITGETKQDKNESSGGMDVEKQGKKSDGIGMKKRDIYIIIAAYVLYIVFIIKKSRQWYTEAVGSYLAPEVEQFLAQNEIQKDTEQKFTEIRTEMETEWQNLILMLLSGENYQEQIQVNSEAQQFQMLVKEWETIRRLA